MHELVMVRDGVFASDEFARNDVCALIYYLPVE